ncbi:MAG: hypothetical protein AB1831_01930 [Pseudomonadota bacterium]
MAAHVTPEPHIETKQGDDKDTLDRFRNWPGFLAASLALNVLFVYGMLGNVADPAVRTWFKALVWLPFNAIATAVYLMLALKLARVRGGPFFLALCLVMVVANWAVMLWAGH